MDIFDEKKRSLVMSHIRGKGNKSTELALISIFKELGIIGWRRGSKLKGKPDFVFPKPKIAVFADGCFGHGHEYHKRMPQTNEAYWLPKIVQNKRRDIEVSAVLKDKGWQVIRVWECELKKKNRDQLMKKLQPLLFEKGGISAYSMRRLQKPANIWQKISRNFSFGMLKSLRKDVKNVKKSVGH